MTAPFVDAHLHLWDRSLRDHPWLESAGGDLPYRYLPEDVSRSDEHPRAVVFVQAQCRPEQSLDEAMWASEQVRQFSADSRVVAFAPLEADELPSHLEALAGIPSVTGVRRLLQDEPPEFFALPSVIGGLRRIASEGLVFDACIRHHQFDYLLELVHAVPEVRIVLDHLGKPPVRDGWHSDAAEHWHAAIRELAERPQTTVKLSGLAPESHPGAPMTDAAPFVEAVLAAFGPDRCMAGSDYPVSRVASRDDAYAEWFDWVGSLVSAGSEREAVLRGTALTVYGGAL